MCSKYHSSVCVCDCVRVCVPYIRIDQILHHRLAHRKLHLADASFDSVSKWTFPDGIQRRREGLSLVTTTCVIVRCTSEVAQEMCEPTYEPFIQAGGGLQWFCPISLSSSHSPSERKFGNA